MIEKVDETLFHYSDVCRGRYLCEDHGGFCDGADNYIKSCPICEHSEGTEAKWYTNRVDRLLHLVNGLQKRSQRNASLTTLTLGGFGALTLVTKISASEFGLARSGTASLLFQFGLAFLVLSIAFYSLSMAQIPIAKKSVVPSMTINDWGTHLERKLAKLERWHSCAGFCFFIAVLSFFFTLCVSFIGLLCNWQ
ncbi:MAG: hypothetical protein JKY31_11425 [Rhodobacteraceae bacterium]|nr:hypothetical protein [Paracoccaceae bacterium]